MDYTEATRTVLKIFKEKNKRIITTEDIEKALRLDPGDTPKKYIRRMIKDGILDVGVSYYIRNDSVYRLLYGFEVYISREKDRNVLEAISLKEWLDYVESDSEMRHDGFAEANNPIGESIRINKEGVSVWNAHPSGDQVWFFCSNERIIVKNPDQESIKKMFVIAKTMNAIVDDENGDIYGEDGLRVKSMANA